MSLGVRLAGERAGLCAQRLGLLSDGRAGLRDGGLVGEVGRRFDGLRGEVRRRVECGGRGGLGLVQEVSCGGQLDHRGKD